MVLHAGQLQHIDELSELASTSLSADFIRNYFLDREAMLLLSFSGVIFNCQHNNKFPLLSIVAGDLRDLKTLVNKMK